MSGLPNPMTMAKLRWVRKGMRFLRLLGRKAKGTESARERVSNVCRMIPSGCAGFSDSAVRPGVEIKRVRGGEYCACQRWQ